MEISEHIENTMPHKTPATRKNGRSKLFGFNVDRMTLDECLKQIEDAIANRERLHIVLVNAAKVVKSRSDNELAHIIRTADLVGADGVPIVWASYFLSKSLPGRVNGTDLMDRLFVLSAQKGYRVYLLGATQNVIEDAITRLKAEYPKIEIAGYRNGYFYSQEEEEKAISAIANAHADILLVGMSTPLKEKWVRSHIRELNVPVIHGVGGSFDILSGLTRRAPVWMQNYGLEWFYRLLQEPKRLWKRYLVGNTMYISLVFQELFRNIRRIFNLK